MFLSLGADRLRSPGPVNRSKQHGCGLFYRSPAVKHYTLLVAERELVAARKISVNLDSSGQRRFN